MYLDSAYIAKFYLNETDASEVRKLVRNASYVCSSAWALIEVTGVFKRGVREGSLTPIQGLEMIERFQEHVNEDSWNLIRLSDSLMQQTIALMKSLPANVPLRAGDAVHLATAISARETAIWTNDRHLLAAAPHFGIVGKSV